MYWMPYSQRVKIGLGRVSVLSHGYPSLEGAKNKRLIHWWLENLPYFTQLTYQLQELMCWVSYSQRVKINLSQVSVLSYGYPPPLKEPKIKD